MRHPYASWFNPDKIIKDIIWNDMAFASSFAKGSLLDIGCGTKPYKQLFLHAITSYIGIDARNRHADIKKDFLTASIKPSSYDTVLSTQVIEHVSDPVLFIKKIHTILRKHGVLILTAPLVAALHEEPYDYYRFTKHALKQLLEKEKFEVLLIKEEGNWISSNITMTAFHLELIANRFFLKYPKKLFIALLMMLGNILSCLPKNITKPKLYPMNYLVVAKKK